MGKLYTPNFCRHFIGIPLVSQRFLVISFEFSFASHLLINDRVSEIATGIIPREELKSTLGQ